MWTILSLYRAAFLQGLLVTIELTLLPTLIGIPLGIILGIIGARRSATFNWLIVFCNFAVSSIPALVLLFWLHYPLQSLFHIVINPFWTAAAALSVIQVTMTAAVVLRELKSIPSAYLEAGKTLGLSIKQILYYIELPILSRKFAPQFLSNIAIILQLSLLASFISVPELFRTAQNINAQIYRPVEVYSLLVIFFLLILGPLNLIVNLLKKKYVAKTY